MDSHEREAMLPPSTYVFVLLKEIDGLVRKFKQIKDAHKFRRRSLKSHGFYPVPIFGLPLLSSSSSLNFSKAIASASSSARGRKAREPLFLAHLLGARCSDATDDLKRRFGLRLMTPRQSSVRIVRTM
jgi:hypothetical protein